MKLRIREEMKRQNISCPKLAEMTGIKYRTLDEFLRRESGNFTILVKVADALGVPIDSLVYRDGQEAPYDHPPAAPPGRAEEGEEDVISELSDYRLHGMLKEMELRYQEEQPDLAQQASSLSANLFTKFKADIDQAERFFHTDRELALKLYAGAFLTATAEDMDAFRKSHMEALASLCREFGDANTAASIVEKFTAAEYRKKRKHLVVLASVLAEYGFIEEAAHVMKAV